MGRKGRETGSKSLGPYLNNNLTRLTHLTRTAKKRGSPGLLGADPGKVADAFQAMHGEETDYKL